MIFVPVNSCNSSYVNALNPQTGKEEKKSSIYVNNDRLSELQWTAQQRYIAAENNEDGHIITPSIKTPEEKAYYSVLNLARQGYFQSEEEKNAQPQWLDLKDLNQRNAFELANRYFSPDTILDDLSDTDRALCNTLHNEYRLLSMPRIKLPKANDSHLKAVSFLDAGLRGVRRYQSISAICELTGLIAKDEHPMNLQQFKRLYPNEILTTSLITQFLEGRSPTPLNHDVIEHLNSRAIILSASVSSSNNLSLSDQSNSSIGLGVKENQPLTPEQLLENVQQLQAEMGSLAEEIEEAANSGRLVDPTTVTKAREIGEDKAEVVAKLKSEWNKREEYWKKGMECIEKVAKAIYQDLERGRIEKSAIFHQQQVRSSHTEVAELERKRRDLSAAGYINYRNIELFAHDQYHPGGALPITLDDLKRHSQNYSETVSKLRSKYEDRKAEQKNLNSLFQDIDRNDAEMKEYYKRLQQSQEGIARALRHLTTTLSTAAAILAVVPGVNAVVAASAAAAGAVSSVAGGIASGNLDATRRQERRHLDKSHRLQNMLGQTYQSNQRQRDDIESLLQSYNHMLLTQSNSFDVRGLRQNLKNAISDIQGQISEANNIQNSAQSKNSHALSGVIAAQKYVDDKREEVRKAQEEYDNKGGKKREKKLNEAKRKLTKAEIKLNGCKGTERQSYNLLAIANDKLEDLNRNKTVLQAKLDEEIFLAPMKEQIEEVIFVEHRRFDLERDEDGKLTKQGMAQRQMRISFADYNNARIQERQMVGSLSDAIRGLGSELQYLTGYEKSLTVVDFCKQIYQLYDRHKYFKEAGLPQFQKFMETLQVPDGVPFLDKLNQLHGVEVICGFVIPGLQTVTAALAAGRLLNKLVSTTQCTLSPEQQFLLSTIHKAFKEHQKILRDEIGGIKNLLVRQKEALDERLKGLHDDLIAGHIMLSEELGKTRKEVIGSVEHGLWKQYQTSVSKTDAKLRNGYKLFCLNSSRLSLHKLHERAMMYLDELLVQVEMIKKPHLNGLEITTDEGKVSHFDLRHVGAYPEYFSGLLALHSGDEKVAARPIANIVLHRTLSTIFDSLCKGLSEDKRIDMSKLQPKLDAISAELKAQNVHIQQLKDSLPIALENVERTQKTLHNSIVTIHNEMEKFRLLRQRAMLVAQVQKQRHRYAKARQECVGADKYFLNDILSAKALADPSSLDLKKSAVLATAKDVAASSLLLGYSCSWWGGFAGPLILTPVGAEITVSAGMLGMFGGIAAATAVGTVAFGAIFASAVGIGKLYNAVTDPNNMTMNEFYSLVQVKIVDKVSQPLSDFELSGVLTDDVTLKRFATMYIDKTSSVGFRGAFSNGDKAMKIERYSAFGSVTQDININNATGKTLLRYDVDYNLHTLNAKLSFHTESVIQAEDFVKMKTIPPVTESMKVAEQKLLDGYYEWLESLSESSEPLAADHPYAIMAAQGEPLVSHSGERLTQLFPREILDAVAKQLEGDIISLAQTKTGVLVQSFDFALNASDDYVLTFYLQLDRPNGESQQFCPIVVATYDKATVECFRKVTFSRDEASGKDTYSVGSPNLDEFLAMAIYSGAFGVALPGRGTLYIENGDLYVPYLHPCVGLFNFWKEHPTKSVYHRLNHYDGDSLSMEGPPWQPRPSLGYISIWNEVQKKKRSDKIFQGILDEHSLRYHVFQGVLKLAKELDTQSCRDVLKNSYKLINPAKPHHFYG